MRTLSAIMSTAGFVPAVFMSAPVHASALREESGVRRKGGIRRDGPGYREASGRCAGLRHLSLRWVTPPACRWSFEDAPGMGANKVCATHKHKCPCRGG